MIIQTLAIVIFNIVLINFFQKIANFINVFDNPDSKRKIHNKKVASIGGLIIFSNISLFFFLESDLSEYKILWTFAFIIFLIGFIDDKFKINSNLKFFLFIIFAYLLFKNNDSLILNDLNFSFLNQNISLGKFSLIFSIFSIVIFMNAFNMFDGINLQASLYSIFIFLIFISNNYFTNFSIIIIVSLIFFLYLNYKNICFLGDSGSLLIAFLISYIFINSASKNIFYADEILLIMLLPGLELIRLFFFRIIKKKSPFSPDNNHLHHYLIKNLGLIKTNYLVISLTIFLYLFALLLNSFPLSIFIGLIIYFFVLFYFKKK
tara:strand:- start:2188 stop:3144 length:957 start_codon:yes stop_codon:yes gene_type:complete